MVETETNKDWRNESIRASGAAACAHFMNPCQAWN